MMKSIGYLAIVAVALLFSGEAGADVVAKRINHDLSLVSHQDEAIWKVAKEESIELMGQPMIPPKPKETLTAKIKVQAVHDGKWLAFRLRWSDPKPDEAGKLGEFSDAVAIQFPVKEGDLPLIFMGNKDNPVHLYHWRAQYQRDAEVGKKDVKDIYPNMNMDLYPMEFEDEGRLKGNMKGQRELYAHGVAAGNPQSSPNKTGVDEIFAEGYGTSVSIENTKSWGRGQWKNGEWTVVISRAMTRDDASNLAPGKDSNLGFAVWQGQADEVGARKSVTMIWTPLKIEK